MQDKEKKKVALLVNGERVEKHISPNLTLLRFLRDELHLTGTKDGCSKGQCGACTVIIDGEAKRSCLQMVAKLEGKKVETIEGLARDGLLHPLQEAFLSAGAVQCGFCTPGMILAAKALLESHPSPSDEEIREGLKHNLCRCTGYVKIIEALKIASASPGQQPTLQPPLRDLSARPGYIGISLPDIDGALKVTGELRFTDDVSLEAMGYGAIVWSQCPHAEVLTIDTSKARTMAGVRAVLTAQDIPGIKGFGLFRPDQPVLAEKKVRFLGDPVALVVADSREIASTASHLISVQYKKLQGLFSPQDALRPDAPFIHEQGNIMRHFLHRVGDIDKGFSESDIIVENDYSTPFIEHAYLETEAALAALSGDGAITVWTCTQFPFEFQSQIAASLGVPEEKVRVVAMPLGGAFGGKTSVTVQILAALGALRTGRPVKITLTREESLRFSSKKHASSLHYKTGFSREGKITANQVRIILDVGPYTDTSPIVVDQATIFSCGPYEVHHGEIEASGVFTNNANGGAMRGFGINQVAFAMEQQMDIAAETLKIDPFELRLRNALEPGKRTISGELLRASAPLKETINAVRNALKSLPALSSTKKMGVGIASGFKNVGVGKGSIDSAGAILELTEEGKFKVYLCTVDMGQGNRTAMVQMVAHELGVQDIDVEIVTGDTALVIKAVGVAGERATYSSGNAVIGAAGMFKKALLDAVSQEYALPLEALRLATKGIIAQENGADGLLTFREIGHRLAARQKKVRVEYTYEAPKTFPISHEGIPESGTVIARYVPSDIRPNDREDYRNYLAYTYITSAAIVEVDELTGAVAVKKVLTACDVGKAINPQKIEGQLEGSIAMGMGYALSEQFEVHDGIPARDLNKCGVPTIDQTPEILTYIIEDDDPGGPYGAKGISEVATVPVTPAIINAIYNATGVRIFDLPATKDKILKGLRSLDKNRVGQKVVDKPEQL